MASVIFGKCCIFVRNNWRYRTTKKYGLGPLFVGKLLTQNRVLHHKNIKYQLSIVSFIDILV